MRIAVTGVSGFVGNALKHFFEKRGDTVIGLKIRPETSVDTITGELEGCDVLVNLSGTSILARWTPPYKELLYTSRVETTRKLVRALQQCEHPPKTLLNASAVGVYPNGVPCDEQSALGSDFLAALCKDWEGEALEASRLGIRVAAIRFGVVYGKGGGAMEKMLPPFKLGVGGKLGKGQQMVSWIHIDDLVRAMLYIIEHDTLSGIFNGTAPNPLSNVEQTIVMGEALRRPTLFTVPEFVIKLIFGEGSGVMLDSKEVYPQALLEAGFQFHYPTFDKAFEAILR